MANNTKTNTADVGYAADAVAPCPCPWLLPNFVIVGSITGGRTSTMSVISLLGALSSWVRGRRYAVGSWKSPTLLLDSVKKASRGGSGMGKTKIDKSQKRVNLQGD